VCDSDTGMSADMRDFYEYWEREVRLLYSDLLVIYPAMETKLAVSAVIAHTHTNAHKHRCSLL